ncbi:MAG: class I SAM-dependent methyltransferase [Planctomycetes bacterium]|nr:class I SAM-dependent methyltransferase [Planctomycetota bacterium]
MIEQTGQRKQHEIEHGRKISAAALKIWGHDKKAGQARVRRRIKMMIEMGKIGKEVKVLELGCGTGEFTKHLAPTGADITAIDISPDLLAVARRNLAVYANVKLAIGDMEKLDNLPDDHFSCIVGNSVLHHVDYAACLSETWKKLGAGGRIVFSEPNMLNPQIALQKNIPWLKKALGDSPDETAFFRWRLAGLMKKLGFKNVKVANFDFLHPKLPDFIAGMVEKPVAALEKVPLIKEISGSLLIYGEK